MTDTILWAGDQASFQAFVNLPQPSESQMKALAEDDMALESKNQHWALENQDGVGVIHVKGMLINGEAGFYRYFGAMGYSDIVAAATTAMADPSIGSILLYMESSGGMVAGVDEASRTLATLGKIKPIVTFNASQMMSAALWLGSAGKKIVTGATALNGSLGVMQVHSEYSKRDEKEGITRTIIRAGEDKVLANPHEPLTNKAKAGMQAVAEGMYDIFVQTVADNRGHSKEFALKNYAGGKIFLGAEAVALGLADKVGSYEDAYGMAKKAADKLVKVQAPAAAKVQRSSFRMMAGVTNFAGNTNNNATDSALVAHNPAITEGSSMSLKTPVNVEALIASTGLTPEQVAAAVAAMDAGTETAASGETGAPIADASGGAPTSAPVTTPTSAPVAQPTAQANAEVTALQANLASVNALLAASTESLTQMTALADGLKAQLATANADLSKAKTDMEPFVALARKGLTAMGINFGLNAESVSKLTASEVLAEHERVSALFVAKFKAGPVASTQVKPEPAKMVVPMEFAIRTNQVSNLK